MLDLQPTLRPVQESSHNTDDTSTYFFPLLALMVQ